MYARRDMVAVYYHDCDNTLAGNNKYAQNAYSPSNKVANITKAY